MTRKRTRPALPQSAADSAKAMATFDQQSAEIKEISSLKEEAERASGRDRSLLDDAIKRRSKSKPKPKP